MNEQPPPLSRTSHVSATEPWAFAVTWDWHTLYDSRGNEIEYFVCATIEQARAEAYGLYVEEGDEEPRIVPLYPREDVSK